ncbi:hypothetical protein AAG906_017583 [Vitis piasezkii]
MMDLGNVRRIPDMEIVRNKEDLTLFLSQNGYLEKVLKRVTHVCNGVLMTDIAHLGVGITGYVDSDHGDLDKRRLTTSYIFTLFGGPISWKSQLQSIVALSTTEVEYITATKSMKEVLWLQGLVKELGVTKHVDVRYHFIRETVMDFGGDLDPWM